MCEGEGEGEDGMLKGMMCILLGMGGECGDSICMYVRLCIMSR